MKKLTSRLRRLSSVYRNQRCEPELGSESVYESKFTASPEPACLLEKQAGHEPVLASTPESERELVSSHGSARARTATASTRRSIALDGCARSSATIATDHSKQHSIPHATATLSRLEQLPPEIHRRILFAMPDLPALRALVRASPKLHSVYVQDRLLILGDCVNRSIGSDAHATYLTGTESFRRSDITMPTIRDFLDGYKKSRTGGSPPPTIANAVVRLEDYVQLARFHLSVVEPLTERYALWALAALGSSPVTQPLSETERRRIQRAMYRLETFCNLCSERSPCQMWSALDRLQILSTFDAWEVEEMLCFHEFAKERISSVFHQVALDLLSTLKPYGRSLVNDHGVIDGDLRNYLLSCGLTPLLALFERIDTDELAWAVRRYLDDVYLYAYHRDDWLDGKPNEKISNMNDLRFMLADNYLAISKDAQDARRAAWRTDADAAQDSGQETRFEKDSTDSPPLAWVLHWNGKASNLFGDFVPASFRRWGYVMWDAHRLDAGAKAYIASQPASMYTERRTDVVYTRQ